MATISRKKKADFMLPHGIDTESIALPVVILLMAILFSIFEPRFASTQNIQNVSRQGSILAMLAFAEAFPVLVGGVDISIGAMIAAISIICALSTLRLGVVLGSVIGIMFGGLLGLINGTIVALFKVAPFVVTLGMLSVSHAIALMMTNGQPVVGMPAGFAYLGASYWGPVPIPVVIALGIFFICHFIWSKTTFGRDLYAVGGNPEAARLCGISIQSTIILSYLVMGFLTGIAGIVLTSRVKSGQPNLGLGMELEAIAAVVIGGVSLSGGKGSLFGVLCGAIIISFLRNGLNLLNVSSYVQMLVIGSVIVISAIISKVRSESSS